MAGIQLDKVNISYYNFQTICIYYLIQYNNISNMDEDGIVLDICINI